MVRMFGHLKKKKERKVNIKSSQPPVFDDIELNQIIPRDPALSCSDSSGC